MEYLQKMNIPCLDDNMEELASQVDVIFIAEIESSIATLESERDGLLANGSGKQEWIENIKKYKGIVSLDRSLITFLIERIDVIDGNTLQVTYRFQKEIAELEHVVELYATELKEAI